MPGSLVVSYLTFPLAGPGRRDEWRLRLGDWRVRFRDDHPTRTLEGLRILPRGQAYR